MIIRMRIGCSELRKDLFYNLHVVVEDTSFNCGAEVEDVKHFLFKFIVFEAVHKFILVSKRFELFLY